MSNLKRYSISVVLIALSLVLFIVGALALTIWKPAQKISASGQTSSPYLLTRGGVLPLYGDSVKVTVTADNPSQAVWMAVGDSNDVKAWVADHPYDEIIGLSDLQTLKMVEPTEGENGSPNQEGAQSGETDSTTVDNVQSDEAINPIASDMWYQVFDGTGSVSAVISGQNLEASLLVATDGSSAAPTITLTWSTPQINYLALVALILGGLFLVAAALVALVIYRAFQRRQLKSIELKAAEDSDMTDTSMIPAIPAVAKKRQRLNQKKNEAVSQSEQTDIDPVDQESPVISQPAVDEPNIAEVKSTENESQPTLDLRASSATDPSAPDSSTAEVSDDDESLGKTPCQEQVSTDSGMINVAALQGGGAFPTRRALRDAQRRGVDSLVVDGKEFSTTGSLPVVRVDSRGNPIKRSDQTDQEEATSRLLSKRSTRSAKWRKQGFSPSGDHSSGSQENNEDTK